MEDKINMDKKLSEAIITLHEFYMKNERRTDEKAKHAHDIENLQTLSLEEMLDKLHDLAFRINPKEIKTAPTIETRILSAEDFNKAVENMNIHDLNSNPFCLMRLEKQDDKNLFAEYQHTFDRAINETFRAGDLVFRINDNEILTILKCPLENVEISLERLRKKFRELWDKEYSVKAKFNYGVSLGQKMQKELAKQGARTLDKIMQVILKDAEDNLIKNRKI